MAIYPAYVNLDTDGSASGYFPDVPGCYFATDADEDIYSEAVSALEAHFEALVIENIDIPDPHGMPHHVTKNIAQYQDGGQWYNVMIDMAKFSGKAERINITLPHRLLYQIDNYVKNSNQYASRSAFLAEIARKELSHLI